MLTTPRRILIARDPVDFRKSIDGIAALCEISLKEPPLDGTLYVFTNRRGNALKMLIWTNGGFLLLYKRLERGKFRFPPLSDDRGVISTAELAALMEGIDLTKARRLSRWNPENYDARGRRRG